LQEKKDENLAAASWRLWFAFLISIPIAIVGGLIGLGGAEYRLPVLKGPLRYSAKQAVPLNLAVSMVTLIVSLFTRAKTLSLSSLSPISPLMLSMIAGAMIAAFFGTSYVKHLSEKALERIILVLLTTIGLAFIIEGGLLPQTSAVGFISVQVLALVLLTGFLFGLAIGAFSSVLGVAGGELIIPTLVFVYGVGVKTAGTASVIISLPTVAVGIIRYARQRTYNEKGVVKQTIVPMGIGSVIGALIGGVLVGIVSPQLLKVGLGIILIVSAIGVFRGKS
jgi:uncharacterized protein